MSVYWGALHERKNNANRCLVRKPQGKNRLEKLGVNGNVILQNVFKKLDWMSWNNSLGSEHERMGSFCEHGNEPDAKCKEFLH